MLRFSSTADDAVADQSRKKKKGGKNRKKSQKLDGGSSAGATQAELDLAEELFGKPQDLFQKDTAAQKNTDESSNGDSLWTIDTSSSQELVGDSETGASAARKRPRKAEAAAAAAAWVDEDDGEMAEVNLAAATRLKKLRESAAPGDASVSAGVLEERLRKRFLASNSEHNASWAQLPTAKDKKVRSGDVSDDDQEERGSDSDSDDEYAQEKVLRSTAPLKRSGE